MALFDFLKGLAPTLSKDEVITSVRETLKSLEKYTLPAARTAQELWQGQKFKSDAVKDLEEILQRTVKNKPLFEVVESSLSNGFTLLKYIETYIERIYNPKEATEGMTYAKAMSLRLVQAGELANVYTRRMINYVYWLEGVEVGADVEGPKPAEIKWLEDNFTNYMTALSALRKDKDELENSFKRLPQAAVTADSEGTFTSTLGAAHVDPLGLSSLSVKWNPFYLIGMMVSEWQSERYREAQEELQLLEFRALQIKKLREKTQDAKLDQQINHLQERITGLHAKIDKMEKDYALHGA